MRPVPRGTGFFVETVHSYWQPALVIKARILADSISPSGIRLCTFLVTYPRFVHAEHLRHRAQSFNVASSRAIPMSKFATLVRDSDVEPAWWGKDQPAAALVRDSEVEPVWWGKNQPGMQAAEELTGEALQLARQLWLGAKASMLQVHAWMEQCHLHKQVANRILEPWMPVTVLVSATDWANFFSLRSHPGAQPEMCALSDAMLYAFCASEPVRRAVGEWHVPFGDRMDPSWSFEDQRKVSVARCARLSYLTFDSTVDLKADLALHDKLADSRHWSPFEHVARCSDKDTYFGNFRGWEQYPQMVDPGVGDLDNWDRHADFFHALLLERQQAGSSYACGATVGLEPD